MLTSKASLAYNRPSINAEIIIVKVIFFITHTGKPRHLNGHFPLLMYRARMLGFESKLPHF